MRIQTTKHIFIFAFVFLTATSGFTNQCRDLFTSKISIAAQALKQGTKVDPEEYRSRTISFEEFEKVVNGLIAEKLLWFSIQDFAIEQINRWPVGATIKNFLSYTIDVYVKNSTSHTTPC